LLESQLGRRLPAGLRVPNKPQDDTEAGGREEAPVLLVRNLPYLYPQSSVVSVIGSKGASARSPVLN
jgi:hypothetical protein